MNDLHTFETKVEKIAYLQGMIDSLWLYAWWKDGKMYVGNCGTRFVDAAQPLQDRIYKLQEDE